MTPIFANCALRDLPKRTDERGHLVAIEARREAPFAIERVYYLYGITEGLDRGYHAHRALRQLAICVSGSCLVILDDGKERREILLDDPAVGIEIGPMVWRELRRFSADAVLMVLASAPYDEADYIRDYDEFLALANAR